ncbi:hypothetical protein GPECTOR_34g802 [Gonium pectorale]|uniref:SET domain-containing protein n=1 Tax=Gonium pectorale TaxID=33097 RepID=A0A150GCY7_GONPE|nr:hypothetical protein GPECTOR_34g802 [Gonium pectorale]|eukprot:KXZ47643.1 hypothetical protein GPECTOR_34g802 [Gonium pectorale]
MWRSILSSRFASWVVGFVSLPKERQIQHEMDLQRLYILTQLHKAAAQNRAANMQQLIMKSHSLDLSAVRSEVEASLRQQVLGTAQALHEELVQAGDPALAAARTTAAHARLERQREREASGLRKLLNRVAESRQPPPAASAASALPAAAAAACGAGSSGATQAQTATGTAAAAAGSAAARELSASEVAAALQRRLGFSLELRPSEVPHPEAGTGLFLRGEARAGAVVAIFPGVLYGRTQLAHMPNYPRVDTDNPYLSCRFDQSIVDSKPWGRGDSGPVPGTAPEAASASPLPGPERAVSMSGAEAGQSPNVIEAPLDIALDHPDLDLTSRPWLRAYLPVVQPPMSYDPYGNKYGEEDDGGDDEEAESEEEDEAKERRGRGGEGRKGQRRRAPGELRPWEVLTPPGGVVRLLVLVATRGLRDGEELLQNYRMNPHVARPDWYVVHDAEAEHRRWAKIRALDLGFKGSKTQGPGQGQGAGGGQGTGGANNAG